MYSVQSPVAGADSEARTRDRVLNAVLEHGPVSAAQLGTMLGLTPAAVRRHLDVLEKSGVIEVKPLRGSGIGAGRPARRYVLSNQGQSSLGNDYLEIARSALRELEATAGSAAVDAFARRRYEDMERRYAPVVDAAGASVQARAEALAEALSADGYAASSNAVGAQGPMLSIQLCQGHCPVRELAADHPQFCDNETRVFSRLLGVDVRRLSTLAGGGHVCTTHIPVGRTNVSNQQQERP